MAEDRRTVWNNLPGYFGLAQWEILREMTDSVVEDIVEGIYRHVPLYRPYNLLISSPLSDIADQQRIRKRKARKGRKINLF